jgi:signal transduction histidine kinase
MINQLLARFYEVDQWVKFQLIIEDNGVGISEENIDKLFKDYGRLEEHQNINHKGTGLGLFICKKLITKMGGTVDVESKLGYGSRFIVTLQLKAKDKKLLNEE